MIGILLAHRKRAYCGASRIFVHSRLGVGEEKSIFAQSAGKTDPAAISTTTVFVSMRHKGKANSDVQRESKHNDANHQGKCVNELMILASIDELQTGKPKSASSSRITINIQIEVLYEPRPSSFFSFFSPSCFFPFSSFSPALSLAAAASLINSPSVIGLPNTIPNPIISASC